MKYTKLVASQAKEMAEADLERVFNENDQAQQETEEALNTAKGEVETLRAKVAELEKNQKNPPAEKSAKELAKELF